MRIRRLGSVAAAVVGLLIAAEAAVAAEGFGAATLGGAQGSIVRVTNLNDSGPGSLREAVAGDSRTVVFDVAGTITLGSDITIKRSFLTIDGLAAPPPGITLRGAGLVIRGPGHDIIVRGLRIRDASRDGIWVTDAAHDVLIEYVSVHNSADGNIDITREGTRDVTVAWSILAEPAGEEKNMLIAFRPTRVTLHHNLFIAAQQRNPQVNFDDSTTRAQDTGTTLDMRNNLVWNWRGGYGTRIRYGSRANVVNNYYGAAGGDASDSLVVCRGLAKDSQCYDDTTNVAHAFVDGNVSAEGVNIDAERTESAAFASAAVVTDDPWTAACDVHAGAGVRPLDAIDASYVAAVKLSCGPPPPPPPPANRAPVAQAGPAMAAMVGDTVVFDGSRSHDPDGQALSHRWVFGDGSPTVTGVSVAHVYTRAGRYTASLTVSDGALTSTATVTVTVESLDPGGPGVFHDAFDRPDSTSLGSAWLVARGQAMVRGERLAIPASPGNHVAVVPELVGPTQQVSVHFWSPNNNAAPRFGVVLRYQDPQHYYLMYRVVKGASALRISRIYRGKETVLKQVKVRPPAPNVPFRVNASASGSVLTLDVDGGSRVTVTDATFGSGTVGVSLGQKSAVSLPADDFVASVR